VEQSRLDAGSNGKNNQRRDGRDSPDGTTAQEDGDQNDGRGETHRRAGQEAVFHERRQAERDQSGNQRRGQGAVAAWRRIATPTITARRQSIATRNARGSFSPATATR